MEDLSDSTFQAHLLPLLPRRELRSLAECSNRLRGLVHGQMQHLALGGDDGDAAAQHRCHERFSAVTRVEYTLGNTMALSRFLVMCASHMAQLRSFRLTMPQRHPAAERLPEYLYMLAGVLPSLQHLEVYLPRNALTNEAAQALAAARGLESLTLEDSQAQQNPERDPTFFVRAPMVALTNLTALKRLHAPMLPLATLPALPSLTALYCGEGVEGDCVLMAAKFPALQGLTLLSKPLSWERASALSALTSVLSALQRLELTTTHVPAFDRAGRERH